MLGPYNRVAAAMTFYVTDQGPGEADSDNYFELTNGIWLYIPVRNSLIGSAADEARKSGILEFLSACVDNAATHDYDTLGYLYIITLSKLAASCDKSFGREKSRSLLNTLTDKFRLSDWKNLLEGCHNPYSPS